MPFFYQQPVSQYEYVQEDAPIFSNRCNSKPCKPPGLDSFFDHRQCKLKLRFFCTDLLGGNPKVSSTEKLGSDHLGTRSYVVNPW